MDIVWERRKMTLYIGTNYHPHDWPREQWEKDFARMKEAGFTTVRLGHLCWDSYEPQEGVYTFEWFDKVMDLCQKIGLGVFLDISVRPAPRWVHKLCPGCNIYGKSGNEQGSLRRYMEDVGDPAYQYYAFRFAEKMVERYKDHPALFAFGLCNEIGDGYFSYSEYARKRYVNWLKKKYKTVEALNCAWNSWRWSRRVNEFNDVFFPENEIAMGSPQEWLDMRRFYSDEIGEFIGKLASIVEKTAPGIAHSSNHYAEKDKFGFDYMKYAEKFVDYPGIGFYPGYEAGDMDHYQYLNMVYGQRLTEMRKPMWCLEYQTGQKGIQRGPYGALRMHIFLCLLNRMQMVLGWTWRTMLAGEEQYLYGLLDHDGEPNYNFFEYKWIASDLKKLEKFAFPYLPKPEIAVAYHYDSAWDSQYDTLQFRQPYRVAVTEITRELWKRNMDYNIIDLKNRKENYKVIFIPMHVIIDEDTAEAIRTYVKEGGTVVMTAYSGIADQNGKAWGTPRPGRVDDVFGIRISGFYRTDQQAFFANDCKTWNDGKSVRESLQIKCEENTVMVNVDYYEEIQLKTAKSLAVFQGKEMCAISENRYGKGSALYVAVEPNRDITTFLLDVFSKRFNIEKALELPDGVKGRKIAQHQHFFVNTTNKPISFQVPEAGIGVLSGKKIEKEFCLQPYDGELIIAEN